MENTKLNNNLNLGETISEMHQRQQARSQLVEMTSMQEVRTRAYQNVEIMKLREDAVIPSYANDGDAGVDLCAVEDIVIPAKATGVIIPTGLAMALPLDYELQVRPKSGNSVKTTLRISNAPGTVDEGFRGEIGVIVDNIGEEDLHIAKGKAVAQGVLNFVPKMRFIEVTKLSETSRGVGGYGSSGRGI